MRDRTDTKERTSMSKFMKYPFAFRNQRSEMAGTAAQLFPQDAGIGNMRVPVLRELVLEHLRVHSALCVHVLIPNYVEPFTFEMFYIPGYIRLFI